MQESSSPRRDDASTVALMYHALATGDVDASGSADPHYRLAADEFRAQLGLFRAHAGGAASVRRWLDGACAGAVLVTFDDGHASDYHAAFPLLAEAGASADFFVNPERVGTPGYATWAQLREMADAGQSIQSHGYRHRYFTEFAPAELAEELRRARLVIEERIGHRVTLLAPPGGRMPSGLAALARECGYERVLSSQPGRLHAGNTDVVLPRLAVTADVAPATLRRWVEGAATDIGRARLRYATLGFAKRVLGDRRYERLRARLLGQPTQ